MLNIVYVKFNFLKIKFGAKKKCKQTHVFILKTCNLNGGQCNWISESY